MIAQGTTAHTLETIAQHVGVRVDIRHVRRTRDGGQRVRFGLRLGARKAYQRVGNMRRASDGERRRTGAVCWHGHRDFFRALFRVAPGARVQTMQTAATVPGKWYTAENFESVYGNTGDNNVGSQCSPLPYASACTCKEGGY